MMKNLTSSLVASFAVFALSAGSAVAAPILIGVNFQGNGGATLTAGQSAGVGALAQTNWNQASNFGNNTVTGSNVTPLVNSSGGATSVSLNVKNNDSFYSSSTVTNNTPDNILLDGIIKANGTGAVDTLTFSGLSTAAQNVIVYLAENGTGANGTLAAGTQSVTLTELDGQSTQSSANPVVYTNATTGANYYEFFDVKPVAGAITLTSTHNSGSDGFGIAAVQLQFTPEPSSFVLAGIAGLGLLAVARRRRKA